MGGCNSHDYNWVLSQPSLWRREREAAVERGNMTNRTSSNARASRTVSVRGALEHANGQDAVLHGSES